MSKEATDDYENPELFVKLYTQLEEAIVKKYHHTFESVKTAAENELVCYKEVLDTMRNMRNTLSHSKAFDTKYCLRPHKALVTELRRILEEVDDTTLINNCVPLSNVAWAQMTDKVLPYMQILHDKVYTHIPILDKNKKNVVGVFGESTLMTAVLQQARKGDILAVDENLTFADIAEYLPLDSHTTEEFCFMSRSATVLDARVRIRDAFCDPKKRLGMIFITQNGKPNEALLGILTVWGILGRDMNFNAQGK